MPAACVAARAAIPWPHRDDHLATRWSPCAALPPVAGARDDLCAAAPERALAPKSSRRFSARARVIGGAAIDATQAGDEARALADPVFGAGEIVVVAGEEPRRNG